MRTNTILSFSLINVGEKLFNIFHLPQTSPYTSDVYVKTCLTSQTYQKNSFILFLPGIETNVCRLKQRPKNTFLDNENGHRLYLLWIFFLIMLITFSVFFIHWSVTWENVNFFGILLNISIPIRHFKYNFGDDKELFILKWFVNITNNTFSKLLD